MIRSSTDGLGSGVGTGEGGGGAAGASPDAPAGVISEGGQPPLLIGGLVEGVSRGLSGLVGADVDFLTASVSGVTLDWLMAGPGEVVEPGFPQAGFAQSERREWLGGTVWRRWEPNQARQDWGKSYESWEWDGATSADAARQLAGRELVAPSRVDVRFDFEVEGDFRSDDFALAVEDWARDKNIDPTGIAGSNGVYTRYIGSRSSDRFIRVYRKDLQSECFAFDHGQILRVELVMRRKYAVGWWKLWNEGFERGIGSASAMIHAMTGFRPWDGEGELPQLELESASDVGDKYLAFMRQWGPFLFDLVSEGCDPVSTANLVMGGANQRVQRKSLQRRRRIGQIGSDQLENTVRRVISERQRERQAAGNGGAS